MIFHREGAKFTKLYWIVFVSFVSLCSNIAAQVPQNRIEGRLNAPSGVSLPSGIGLVLRTLSGSQVNSTSVSGNGRFTFDGLAAGKYVIFVRADGFLPVEETVEIPSGFFHNVINVSISLTPRPLEGEGFPKGDKTVPVRSLSVPKQALEAIAEAEKAAARKDFSRAIQHAEKALEIAPAYFEAINNLAVYYYQRGDKAKSAELLNRALLLNEGAGTTHSNLGQVYLELSRPELAVGHLDRAVELDPGSEMNHYHLGRAYILLGQLLLSIQPLERALEGDAPVEHARFLLAHVLHELGRNAQAVRELELYLKTNPQNRRELEQKLEAWKAS